MHDLTPDPYLGTGVLENLLFKPKKLVTVSLLLLVDYLEYAQITFLLAIDPNRSP